MSAKSAANGPGKQVGSLKKSRKRGERGQAAANEAQQPEHQAAISKPAGTAKGAKLNFCYAHCSLHGTVVQPMSTSAQPAQQQMIRAI